ncbi:hypothetical protein [Vibrio sp. VB16]|uniref:hypothetical protein n=1 Tax=Vibrio sp. VB16 TaxID=2785746 RepID=UPI001E647EB3|nr:hypothetical protein [Vibrio sp. VB16]UGA57347.1 hypothetical protein IUZ65_017755 [Vibrio sp. VB16]
MKMKNKSNLLKYSVLASTIALALAGCNSDSSSTDTGDSGSTDGAYTLQAIDGYLVNAEVYADIDQNGTLTDSDELLGTTGDKGTFTVESGYKDYPIIIKAIAGQTFDTDKAGTLTSNVELIAEKGSSVVTPFSTYAVKTGKTLDEVAAELQMDVSMISSDYVASKSNTEQTTKQTAIKVHLAARSIAQTVNTLGTIDTAGFEDKVRAIKNAVDVEFDNTSDKSSLDSKLIELNDSNQPSTEDMPTGTLQSMMLGNVYYGINTNSAYATIEGVSTIGFEAEPNDDGSVTYMSNNDKHNETFEGTATFSYDGFSTVDNGQTLKESIIYYGKDTLSGNNEEFYLNVTDDGDMLAFTTRLDTLTTFSQDEIINQTYYVLFDDAGSTTTPDVTMAKMTFNDDGTMSIVEGSETFNDATWDLISGGLSVSGIYDDGSDWNVMPAVGNHEMILLVNKTETPNIAHVMVKNEDLANSLYQKWSSGQ